MKAIKLCAVVGVAAIAVAACQSADDAANVSAEDAANGNAVAANAAPNANGAPNADATAEPSADAPAERPERPQPEAPRAEGDRLAELLASEDYLLLDVRRPEELEERGTVEGYLNIPIEELADRLEEVPRDRPILTA